MTNYNGIPTDTTSPVTAARLRDLLREVKRVTRRDAERIKREVLSGENEFPLAEPYKIEVHVRLLPGRGDEESYPPAEELSYQCILDMQADYGSGVPAPTIRELRDWAARPEVTDVALCARYCVLSAEGDDEAPRGWEVFNYPLWVRGQQIGSTRRSR